MIAGVNGFGRFGLHFLKYYLLNYKNSKFKIKYINDENLKTANIFNIIKYDKYLNFSKFKVKKKKNCLFFNLNKKIIKIIISNKKLNKLSWNNEIDLLLECSGKYTQKKKLHFLNAKKNIKHIIISATSWDCDQTLIYGLNHNKFNKKKKHLSYGSCTVNAFSVFGDYINKTYGIKDSDVNVVHNVPEYKITKFSIIKKKFCTLESMAPKLIHGITKSNFSVNYTLVPYSGVSMIDFRFKVKKKITKKNFIKKLKDSISRGNLKYLYGYTQKDKDPNNFKESKNNCDFILEKTKIINDNLYLCAYFDNENSVNRYYDLTNYISNTYS